MRFSQKIGITSIREAIQIESIDEKLENRIWNAIINDFFDKIPDDTTYVDETLKAQVCRILWTEFYGERADEIGTYHHGRVLTSSVINYIKNWFFKSDWYEKYDLIEFLSTLDTKVMKLNIDFSESCNIALKKEMAGYRLVDGSIVQITSEEEIVEIEQALNNTTNWNSVNTHLITAISYFSKRDNPDFRNSIKEAISAVESLCIIITDDKNATLGKALSEIEKKYKIHSALKSAFASLYGYTSDSGGIRHALLEDDIVVTMEDAKFMLVSCSAFINYLNTKIDLSDK